MTDTDPTPKTMSDLTFDEVVKEAVRIELDDFGKGRALYSRVYGHMQFATTWVNERNDTSFARAYAPVQATSFTDLVRLGIEADVDAVVEGMALAKRVRQLIELGARYASHKLLAKAAA